MSLASLSTALVSYAYRVMLNILNQTKLLDIYLNDVCSIWQLLSVETAEFASFLSSQYF